MTLTWRKKSAAYAATFRLGVTMVLGDRADLLTTMFIYIVLLAIFAGIYNVLPIHELGNTALTRGNLLWYFALTEIVIMSSGGNVRELGSQIASGQLTTLMQRPGNMMGLLLARVAGNALAHVAILSLVGYVALSLFTTTPFPVAWSLVPLLLLSLTLGVMIFLLLGYGIGTLEVFGPYSRPTSWILSKLVFSFGGLFFPVLFFPQLLQQIVAFTPFPSIIGTPANFALLTESGLLFKGLALQFVWITIVTCGAIAAKRRMLRVVLTKGE